MRDSPGSELPKGPSAGIYSEPARSVDMEQTSEITSGAALDRAAVLVAKTEVPTPLRYAPGLSQRMGKRVFLKLETESPIRSFKHRGALVALDNFHRSGTADTVVTASTGNHGQGVAYAAGRVGMATIVIAPTTTAFPKIEAMQKLGADVRIQGENLGQSQALAQELADEMESAVYIEDGEHPDLMAGAATVMREILEICPEADTVLVPVGGGNLIAGSLATAQRLRSEANIIGIQSSAASGVTHSWLSGQMAERSCETFAGGLATTRPGNLSLEVMTRLLKTMVVVDEQDLRRGISQVWAIEGIEVEAAAAAPIAAATRFPEVVTGETVVMLITGGWLSDEERQLAVGA